MASQTTQRHDVAAQSESMPNALELARQRARAASAAYGDRDAATTETNSRPTPSDDLWLNAYGEQLRSLQRQSLELRWQIGTTCNEHLSGRKTSKDVASRIGCGLPDLHLMMWFARRVPDLNDFLDKHPAVASWGKARQVVAQLSPNGGTRKRSALGKLIGLVRKLTSQTQEGNVAFEKKEVEKLSSVLVRFTLALERSSRSADASVEEND